jgi:basic membrane protein A
VVDSTITDSEGNALTLDNVYTMTFKEQEGGFLAGVAAALSTKSDKVAVVNGMPFPSNVNYELGFMSGVAYANENYGTAAECIELPSYAGTDLFGNEVGGNYTGDFTDEAQGKVVGEALIDEGCDVIFVAAGASGNGVFTAAKEADDVYVIGCDVDQFDDGVNGSGNIILTSSLKVMHSNVKLQLENIYNGTFSGQDAILGADTDSTGIVTEEGRQQLDDGVIEKLDECYELIKSGDIVPASQEDFQGLK